VKSPPSSSATNQIRTRQIRENPESDLGIYWRRFAEPADATRDTGTRRSAARTVVNFEQISFVKRAHVQSSRGRAALL